MTRLNWTVEYIVNTDYRKLLQELLAEKKLSQRNLSNRFLAEAIGIQPTYMSRVFHCRNHISADQLYLATRCLRLSDVETEILMLLRDYQITEVEDRRSRFFSELTSWISRLHQMPMMPQSVGSPTATGQTL